MMAALICAELISAAEAPTGREGLHLPPAIRLLQVGDIFFLLGFSSLHICYASRGLTFRFGKRITPTVTQTDERSRVF